MALAIITIRVLNETRCEWTRGPELGQVNDGNDGNKRKENCACDDSYAKVNPIAWSSRSSKKLLHEQSFKAESPTTPAKQNRRQAAPWSPKRRIGRSHIKDTFMDSTSWRKIGRSIHAPRWICSCQRSRMLCSQVVWNLDRHDT